MDVDRLLARAAVTPPAVVLQTTFANGLGIIRDLAAHGVPVLALDRGQLDEVYATVDDCGTLMYQEIIPGGGGGVAILWHNNRFDRRSAQGYDDVYWRLVAWAQVDGGLVASAREIVRRWQDATGEAA